MTYTPQNGNVVLLNFVELYPSQQDGGNVRINFGGASEQYQICSDGILTYTASSEGLILYNNTSEMKLCTKPVGEDYSVKSVWCNSTKLYIGADGGLYEAVLSELHAGCGATIYACSFSPLSNSVKYLHGKGEELLVVTTSGIDYFNNTTNPNIRSSSTSSGIVKCFLTTNKAYYIKQTAGPIYSINRVDNLLCSWTTPTTSYTTGSGILQADIQINSLFITEGTASAGGNTVFCTTTSGVYVIDEDSLAYDIYYTNNLSTNRHILYLTSNNFNAIWCDSKASLNAGRFYITRPGDITIVNNTSGQPFIEDYYSLTSEGEAKSTLTSENISNFTVVY